MSYFMQKTEDRGTRPVEKVWLDESNSCDRRGLQARQVFMAKVISFQSHTFQVYCCIQHGAINLQREQQKHGLRFEFGSLAFEPSNEYFVLNLRFG